MTKPHAPKRVTSKLRSESPTEVRGDHSGVEQPGQFVAKTQKEWTQMWNAAHSNMHPVPKAPKLPKGKMAVGIFAGQTSSRTNINVTGVESADGTTTVKWESSHTPSMLAVMFENFLLKFVDKTDNDVVFSHAPAQRSATPAAPGQLPPRKPF
jgi:hypothetical protein